MTKKKYSRIWLHFDDEEGQKAKCRHCQAILSLSGGCHSNLRRHLRAKHPRMPFNIEGDIVPTEDIKVEDPMDEESSTSTQIRTITQDYELSEFINRSPVYKAEENETETSNTCSNVASKRKHSAIWLHFIEEGNKRARCKHCNATLSFSCGSHGNLGRHLKSKHPFTIFNLAEQVSFSEEAQSFEELIDEQPSTTTQLEKVRQGHQIAKLSSRFKKDQRVYFKSSTKRKYSVTWLHFDDLGSKRAMCKHCQKTISFAGGCHGNLRRHLKLKHPLMPLNVERKVPQPRQMVVLEDPIDDKPSISSQQLTQPNEEVTQSLKDQIDRQVLKMIVKGNHSFCLLEEPEFHKLIYEISNCSGYTLPSKNDLLNDVLPSVRMELLEDIKRKIEYASAVCLSIDGWTSMADISCFTVTAHYINSDTVLISHVLAYGEFENLHTAVDLCNFINNTVCEFQINTVTAIVSTNEQNIGTAIRQGEWRGITCFAHSLHLILQAATVEIADTINKVKRIVEYFDKNDSVSNELQIMQDQMNLPEIKLMQDDTRWNSTFEMLQRIHQTKDTVSSIISINRPDLMLAIKDWEIVDESIQILRPFHEVIVEISGESSVNLSKVTILSNLLERHIAKCLPSSEEVTAMVINLQMGIASCFGNLEKVNLYAESTLLDPRFKRKGFKSDASYEEALKSLENKICSIKLPFVEEDNTDPLNTFVEESESLWEAYDMEFNKTVGPDDTASAGQRELANYINEEYLDRKKDPLLWWKERKHIYPRLYFYVLKRFCIVATSIPCERIFTANGQMLNERRIILRPNETEDIIFLHNNM